MHHHLTIRAKVIIMLSVMASLFLVALDQTIFSTALGKIVEEFNAFSSLSWVITAYLLATTIAMPIAGRFSDMFGRRLMLVLGIFIFAVSSMMGGLSGNITQLVIWRAVEGIGGGIITANAFTIVGDLFSARERGKWQGMIGAVFGLSSVVGPLLGGYLTEPHNILGFVTNWRWTLFVNVPIGIVALIVILLFCPTLKHDKKPAVDYAGATLLAVALGVFILAIDNTDKIFADFMGSTGISLLQLRLMMLAIVSVVVALFIMVERRAKEPILPMYFFKNRNYVLIISIALLFGASFLGSILYLTQFNQQVFGASPSESGLMLMPLVGGLMFTSIGSGQLISRFGKYKAFMQVGAISAAIAIIMLTALSPESGYWYEAVIMVFLGMGLGVVMPIINLTVQNEFSQADLGAATSSSQLFRGLGSTVGVAVFGAVLTAGVVAGLGDTSKIPYIKTLSQNPTASKIGSFDNSDTLLTLNTPDIKNKISDQANKAFAQLPAPIAKQAKKQFNEQQSSYASIVTHAYSDGMHNVFVIAACLMSCAAVITFAIQEKPLRSAKPTETPGEV